MQGVPYIASLFNVCIEAGHSFFVNCFWQIFVAICPLAVIALYLSMTVEYTFKERIATAKLACWISWGVMMLTAVLGPAALKAVGIEITAFKIAGGIFLVITGFGILRSDDPEVAVSKDDIQEIAQLPKKHHKDIAIAPLAIPLIVGPSVLTIIIGNRAEERGAADMFSCIAAITLVAILMYWILYLTSKGAKWLTPIIMKLSFRLSGLFLVAIGVQFVMNGLGPLVK